MSTSKPRVGLVLGGGGPVGHAYHCAGLLALEQSTGWDPRNADVIVGTSAGAQVGALLRAGMSTADLNARVTRTTMTDAGAAVASHYRRPRPGDGDPAGGGDTQGRRLRPASTERLLLALRRPWQAHPGTVLAAAVPQGRTSLVPMADGLREVFGDTWPDQPTWFVALRIDTGQRAVFGKPGAPHTDVGTAVAASCAVPGIYAPVEVEFSRYVDGGVVSPTNADVLADEGLDLVVVVAPMGARTGAGMRPDIALRHTLRLLLDAEVRKLGRAGIATYVIQPGAAELDAMGVNAMDVDRMAPVAHVTLESVTELLAHDDEACHLGALRTAAQHAQ